MPYRTLAKYKHNGAEAVREYAPCRRTITIGNGREFSLQMPYMLFLRINETLYVAFSLKSIQSLKDIVYCATLGNIYTKWRVCGYDGYDANDYEAKDLNKNIMIFWNSRFTSDGRAGRDPLSAAIVNGNNSKPYKQ